MRANSTNLESSALGTFNWAGINRARVMEDALISFRDKMAGRGRYI